MSILRETGRKVVLEKFYDLSDEICYFYECRDSYIKVLLPSSRQQANVHRTFAFEGSNLSTKEKSRKSKYSFCFFGPSVEIRTRGLLNPIQARYQTSPHPDLIAKRLRYNSTTDIKNQVLFFNLDKNFLCRSKNKYYTYKMRINRQNGCYLFNLNNQL